MVDFQVTFLDACNKQRKLFLFAALNIIRIFYMLFFVFRILDVLFPFLVFVICLPYQPATVHHGERNPVMGQKLLSVQLQTFLKMSRKIVCSQHGPGTLCPVNCLAMDEVRTISILCSVLSTKSILGKPHQDEILYPFLYVGRQEAKVLVVVGMASLGLHSKHGILSSPLSTQLVRLSTHNYRLWPAAYKVTGEIHIAWGWLIFHPQLKNQLIKRFKHCHHFTKDLQKF